jgi:hypothetical protein
MISKKLKDEIWDYCRLNDITDINTFIEKMVQQGYNIEKYGTAPIDFTPEVIEKIVEIEVEKEVEKIVEVEKEVIKEIPVEVIKEVIREVEKIVEVEKEVYKTDDEVVNKLQEELKQKSESYQSIIDGMKKDAETSDEIWGKQDKKIIRLQNDLSISKDKIWELEKELEEEKKKPKRVKREIKAPESTNRKSSINWVPRDDRESDNFYND